MGVSVFRYELYAIVRPECHPENSGLKFWTFVADKQHSSANVVASAFLSYPSAPLFERSRCSFRLPKDA